MAGAIAYYSSSSGLSVNTPGSSGQACISGGTGAPTFGTLSVAGGGTGLTTLTTAYGVVCAGTTPTGALQNAGAGTASQILTSNGASALPSFLSAGLQTIAISSAVSSSPYVVNATTEFFIPVDTTAARTIQLPNAPATGKVYVIKDATGTASSFNISVTTVGGAVNIDSSTTYTISTDYGSINVAFNGTKYYVF